MACYEEGKWRRLQAILPVRVEKKKGGVLSYTAVFTNAKVSGEIVLSEPTMVRQVKSD